MAHIASATDKGCFDTADAGTDKAFAMAAAAAEPAARCSMDTVGAAVVAVVRLDAVDAVDAADAGGAVEGGCSQRYASWGWRRWTSRWKSWDYC